MNSLALLTSAVDSLQVMVAYEESYGLIDFPRKSINLFYDPRQQSSTLPVVHQVQLISWLDDAGIIVVVH